MALNNEIEPYDHPMYKVRKVCRFDNVNAPVSTTDFAHFRSRNQVIVRAVHVYLRSVVSSTASVGSLVATRNGTTIQSFSIHASAISASLLLTLTTSNTLNSMTDYAAIRFVGFDNGKWDVMWEYDVCYPATKIGS